ncbi:HAMP domain-containing sensor histidine kinase [Arthrobacter sp. ATA002]|uniref:sensor histidine kinase n=1 Tax=Arthrobacter sp. ATA002 TaxID=2991715 RepID=UPI0022A67328|nr:HAMP domain-containing sensor histidine kinase [Arthrobacter sp. ATA002]WAP50525.1 HAMP domain-containing sensor histidine kinase [Arthrobacter sp. ATA002]
MRYPRRHRENAELTRASLRLAVQFTVLVVLLLGLAGVLVYGLVASQTREAAEQTLSSAIEFDSPREVPLDVFLAVYDDGRLAVSRNMPSGLPDEEALAGVAETGRDRRDTVTAGGRTYEVLTARRGPNVVQAAVDTREATEQLHRLALALAVSVAAAGLAAGAVSALAARTAMRPMAEALALQRRFVADASHELRTPLTLLSTRAQLLRRRLVSGAAGAAGAAGPASKMGPGDRTKEPEPKWTPDAEAVRAADDVVADTKVLTGILEDLLMAADPRQTGDAEPVNLVDLARSAVGTLQPEALRRRLSLELDAPEAAVTVLGGQFALLRIFTALGANALDYARTRVRVSVRTSGRDAVIRVSDDGPGFPPGFSRHAFERFASVRQQKHEESLHRTRQEGLSAGTTEAAGTEDTVEATGAAGSGAGSGAGSTAGEEAQSPEPRHYGLGLALVAEIAARYDGSVRALPAAAGAGGVLEVRLPLARFRPRRRI